MEGVTLYTPYTRPWSWRRGGWALPFVAAGAAARSVWEVSVGAPRQRKNGMRLFSNFHHHRCRRQVPASGLATKRARARGLLLAAALGGENETRLGWVHAPGGICAPVHSVQPHRHRRLETDGIEVVARTVVTEEALVGLETGRDGGELCLPCKPPGVSPGSVRLPDQEIPSSCDYRTTRPFISSSPSLAVLMPVAIAGPA